MLDYIILYYIICYILYIILYSIILYSIPYYIILYYILYYVILYYILFYLLYWIFLRQKPWQTNFQLPFHNGFSVFPGPGGESCDRFQEPCHGGWAAEEAERRPGENPTGWWPGVAMIWGTPPSKHPILHPESWWLWLGWQLCDCFSMFHGTSWTKPWI